MQTLTHWTGIDPALRGASVALGNFDGVHRGHRAVIDAARRPGLPLGVVTFEPHPREFFQPDQPGFRLMNAETRRNRLARLGVERLYELPFDATLASFTAEAFCAAVLGAGLGVKHVVVGADFCFGKGRLGTAQTLVDLGQTLGFEVSVLPLLSEGSGAISSTAIRAALGAGDLDSATAMLGHRHRIDGPVLHGAKRGRELGYPTANMDVSGLHLPRLGVYAVKVEVLDGPFKGCHDGVASLGVRPMFGVNQPNFEVHLFDFKGDLYGTHLSVALVAFLRDEARFDGLEALITQMDADSARARALLADV